MLAKDCDKQGFIKEKPHIKKNHLSNLMPICSYCHDQVDRGDILIYGWKETNNGVKLDFEVKKDKKEKDKKDKDIKEVIKSLSVKKIKKFHLKNL